jgi:hypothetical protein
MTTQKRGLQEALENAGWSIVEVVTINLDWWADEVWIVQQEQTERTIFLTFVVDPVYDVVRKKGEGVWAVTASSVELQQRWGEKILSLRHGWAKKLPAFIESLNEIQQPKSS